MLLGHNSCDDDIYADQDSQDCAQLFFAEEVGMTHTDEQANKINRDEQPVPTTSKALETISNQQRSSGKSLLLVIGLIVPIYGLFHHLYENRQSREYFIKVLDFLNQFKVG